MRRIGFLTVLFVLLMSAASLPAAAETRVALVIGNANYRSVPSLANPADDARLMAGTLKTLGFKLVGDDAQIDLDKPALDAAIRSFGNQLRGADVGLFYYAGHGLQARGASRQVPTRCAKPMSISNSKTWRWYCARWRLRAPGSIS